MQGRHAYLGKVSVVPDKLGPVLQGSALTEAKSTRSTLQVQLEGFN